MTICPTHNRPLVRTHGGSLICFPCYFERMRKQRTERVTMTNPAHAEKNNARAKKAYHDAKPGKRAEKKG